MKNLIAIPLYNNSHFLKNHLNTLIQLTDFDVIFADDDSTDDSIALLEAQDDFKFISHEVHTGFGGTLADIKQYTLDFKYESLIILNPNNDDFLRDIQELQENMQYGFDIISASRILENYNYEQLEKTHIQGTEIITAELNEITSFQLTDPLAGIFYINTKALEQIEFTDYYHGVLLQMWIQAAYYGMNILEVVSESDKSFAGELLTYDDPIQELLLVMETEKYLYSRGSIN